MTASVTMRGKGQVTLPSAVRESLGLDEGDLLDVRVRDGAVVLVPAVTVPRDQAWFWEDTTQADVAASVADIEAGNVEHFDSGEELIESLTKLVHAE